MSSGSPRDEAVGFLRSPAIPGVEVLDAQYTSRVWTIYNTTYALAVAATWCCEARLGRRSEIVQPGTALCTEPGELHSTPRVYVPGAFHVLTIEPSVLRRYLDERGFHGEPHWRELAPRLSTSLQAKIRSVVRSLRRPCGATQLQTRVAQVIDASIPELIQGHRSPADHDSGRAKAEMLRECLIYEDDPAMDLETLAARTGMNRFQVLRTFKRHFGVAPHAFQNHLRVARAADLLRAGQSPANAATELGFADQSHMTRLFRRIWGVTPGRFATGARGHH